MRILVTRPQPSAAATAARLQAMGHEVTVLPVMEASHQPQAALAALARPHSAIAVTSAEAIRALMPYRVELAPHLQTPVYCVGPATAEATRKIGFQSIVTGTGTGEALAKIITAASANLEDGLVYFAGWPRSPAFEAGLKAAGIACDTAETYRMAAIAHPPETVETLLSPHFPDAVLLYSHETARHFFALLSPVMADALSGARLICLSDHVADAVPAGFGPVSVATEPSEDALLALL
jgi:uroporphyrinogen-III synthase